MPFRRNSPSPWGKWMNSSDGNEPFSLGQSSFSESREARTTDEASPYSSSSFFSQGDRSNNGSMIKRGRVFRGREKKKKEKIDEFLFDAYRGHVV